VNCKNSLAAIASAIAAESKLVEEKAFPSAVAVIPAPRESVDVFKFVAVVVELNVGSLPTKPLVSKAIICAFTFAHIINRQKVVIARNDNFLIIPRLFIFILLENSK